MPQRQLVFTWAHALVAYLGRKPDPEVRAMFDAFIDKEPVRTFSDRFNRLAVRFPVTLKISVKHARPPEEAAKQELRSSSSPTIGGPIETDVLLWFWFLLQDREPLNLLRKTGTSARCLWAAW